MIDRKLITDDFDSTALKLKRKGVEHNTLVDARNLLEERKLLLQSVDELRGIINKTSPIIGRLITDGKKEEANAIKTNLTSHKVKLNTLEDALKQVDLNLEYILLRLPNFPADDCPDGFTEQDNVVLRIHGYDEDKYKNSIYKPHWEIGSLLGIYDADRSAKISGSMFSLLRGEGAKLLRALVTFGLDLNQEKYEEILPPHFVRTETLMATGHLPKFEMEAYKLRDDDLWAIPTGEVPLMSLYRDEILNEDELPRCHMAYTVCFRRESGSYGKDTRGMQRLHEFHKVELLKLCTPEQSQVEFESMLADAERPLQLLGLPYRVVDLCSGDLTFSSTRIFDLEVYAPGVNRWLEVSSIGIFTDFQARRGNIRFRRKAGKTEFVYALNGSAMATPRVWAAVIEHGLQPDGSVTIPLPLIPYMGCEVIRPPKS